MANKIDTFKVTGDIIYELLEKYGVDTKNWDVQQDIANASVSIDNAFNGFDSDGNLVGVLTNKGA